MNPGAAPIRFGPGDTVLACGDLPSASSGQPGSGLAAPVASPAIDTDIPLPE